jgi:stage II sporulation protein M
MSLKIHKGRASGLLLCVAGFIFGSVAGAFISGFLSDAASDEISGAVLNYLTCGESFSAAADACVGGMILSAFLLLAAFSVPGVVFVPVITAAKGFAISCSVAAIFRTVGSGCIGKTALIFGTDAIFTLPFFFALALTAVSASGELAMRGFGQKAGDSIYGGRFIARATGYLAAEYAVRIILMMLFSKFIEF